MPRKGNIKAIQGGDGQRAGTKRAAPDTEVNSRKRRKQAIAADFQIGQKQIDTADQNDIVAEDHTVSRFLELPGELRNRIYEMAATYSHRCFPPTCPMSKAQRRARHKPPSPSATLPNTNPPLPYLALTQVCSQIRTEFRPMWLSTHRFPLFILDSYFKVFYPTPKPGTDRKRLASYFDPAGTLRLSIRPPDLSQTGILKLLKHKAQYPNFNFQPVSNGSPRITPSDISSLKAIIDNSNEKWRKWITGHVIKQVRFGKEWVAVERRRVHLVIKERFAEDWMRSTLNPRGTVPEGYLETLGLESGVEGMGFHFCFGVDYS